MGIVFLVALAFIAFSLSSIASSLAKLAHINELWARESGLVVDPPQKEEEPPQGRPEAPA